MITLGLVDSVDDNGVYVTMPGSKGVLRGPYKALDTAVAGERVLLTDTDEGETVVAGVLGEGRGVSVKAFGALGDGATDDSAAVHAARDAVGVDGVLHFPAGTYMMNVTMSVSGQTWEFAPDAVARCATTSQEIVRITASDTTVRGGTFIGDWDWDTLNGEDVAPAISGNVGIYVRVPSGQCDNVTVQDVTFTRFGSLALWVQPIADVTISRLSVLGCRFEENRDTVELTCVAPDGVLSQTVFKDCHFEDSWMPSTRGGEEPLGGNFLKSACTNGGRLEDILIQDNHFGDRCGRFCLELFTPLDAGDRVKRARVLNNRFGPAYFGAVSLCVDDLDFVGNEVVDFYNRIELFNDTGYIRVENNHFVGTFMWGIHLRDTTVRNNLFEVLGTSRAIDFWRSAECVITDNLILCKPELRGVMSGDVVYSEERTGSPIFVFECTSMTVSRNVTRYEDIEVGEHLWLWVDRSQKCEISGNTWHVRADCTDAGTHPDFDARVEFGNCSEMTVADNRVTSGIPLTSSAAHVKLGFVAIEPTPDTITRRSWDGSAWVDKLCEGVASAPPGSPASGDEWLVGSTPTGAWSGSAGRFAEWNGSSWTFRDIAGWVALNPSTEAIYWEDTTPATGSAGQHLCVAAAHRAMTFAGNDWSGSSGPFPVAAGDDYWAESVLSLDVLIDGTLTIDSPMKLYENVRWGVGFYGTAPAAKPTVTGSRGGNAALASLLSGLDDLGLITDSSS